MLAGPNKETAMMTTDTGAVHAFIACLSLAHESVVGVFGSLAAAQQAAPALRQRQVDLAVGRSRIGVIQEWCGDTKIAEWMFDPETGWSRSIETFDPQEAAAQIEESVRASRTVFEF
jgi:hypothetical protein